MKRHGLALIIHPGKSALTKKEVMQSRVNSFFGKCIELITAHPNFRVNISLPGYLLELGDPLMLSQLNGFRKTDCLEWLTPGYTEPFVAFSPPWLSRDNIRNGLATFEELVGIKPEGYIPAYSNWEPSSIPLLLENGIHYSVLSRVLLSKETQNHFGYWTTEHSGHPMIIFPAFRFNHNSAPEQVLQWLDGTIAENNGLIVLDYLLSLDSPDTTDQFHWLHTFTRALDTLLIKYQLHLLREVPDRVGPLGLQYLPSCVDFSQNGATETHAYSNYLHTYDTVGILQRKMTDLAEKITHLDNKRDSQSLKKKLYFIQDINRFLPGETSGFTVLNDRFWTFGRMIDLEYELIKKEPVAGGQIRITDFLRNGTKSIIMSNKNLSLFIDHINGGQVFACDFHRRSANLFTGHNPERHLLPQILVPGKTCTSFIDHFLNDRCSRTDFINNTAKHFGDFATGRFDYKIKKSTAGVKLMLTRQGFIVIHGKQYPLHMEKVFGIEKEKPDISFAYQLSNHSLTPYSFKFAIELNFALPGAQIHKAAIHGDTSSSDRLAWERVTFAETTKWKLSDTFTGIEIKFLTQKPVTVWCYPVNQASPYQGTTVIITTPVRIEESNVWSLMGKISFRRIRETGETADVL
jgi:hypothetical protein